MLRIRLQRRGKRNYATYRVVVADRHAPVKGRFIADLGYYNPHTNEFNVRKEDAVKWIGNGAQLSATIHNLFITHDIIKGEKVTSWRPKKREEEELKSEGDKEEAPKKEVEKDEHADQSEKEES